MADFCEPQSQEEAWRRLSELKGEVARLQDLIGDRDVRNDNGTRMNDREWWAWKKRMTAVWQERLADLRALKTWMSVNHKKLKRQVRGDVGEMMEALQAMKEMAKRITSNAYGLQERIEELTAENNMLHKRLQEYELTNANPAPDHRREEWRQDNNLDKAKGENVPT